MAKALPAPARRGQRISLESELTVAEMLLTEAAYIHAEGLGSIIARKIAARR